MGSQGPIELTILMPCLNEAETLAVCIDKAQGYLHEHGVSGEVLIADNGSTDGSQDIARSRGARVISVEEKGYGSALYGGIRAARGKYVIMGDADDSYDFTNLTPFLERLRAGDDLVMGNRFRGGIAPGAMPPLHRYLGNPVLSTIGRVLFRSPIKDFHCGLRGFSKEAILNLSLVTTGMEFASEMVVRATLARLRISEVPTTLQPDGRSRPPHLRSWSDGWRHLKFLLIYSPNWLFLYPGIALFVLGLLGTLVLAFGPISVGKLSLGVATQLFSSALALLGFQGILLSVFSKRYAARKHLWPHRESILESTFTKLGLDGGAFLGLIILTLGLVLAVIEVITWAISGWGDLDPVATLRLATPATLAIVIGGQTFMTSMLYGLVTLETQRPEAREQNE